LAELLNHEAELFERPFEIEITIINHGAGSAIIVHSNISFSLDRTNGPLLNNIQPIVADSLCGTLKPGEERSYRFSLDPYKNALSILTNLPTVMSLYVIADWTYRSRLRRFYQTGVCRRFAIAERTVGIQRAKDRFVPTADPDYEYED
jgi:hypothetical protein